jgi:hypothetical protein
MKKLHFGDKMNVNVVTITLNYRTSEQIEELSIKIHDYIISLSHERKHFSYKNFKNK